MALTKWSPFRRLVGVDVTTFYFQHVNDMIYKYDVIDVAPILVYDIAQILGITDVSGLTHGFCIKGDNFYVCMTDGEVITNTGSMGQSEALYPPFMTGDISSDFIYLSGYDPTFSHILVDKFNVVTGLSEKTKIIPDFYGEFGKTVETINSLMLWTTSSQLPDAGFVIWDKVTNNDIAFLHQGSDIANYIAEKLYCSSKKIFVVAGFFNSVYSFYFINENGIVVTTIDIDYANIPVSGSSSIVEISVTDNHFILFINDDAGTFYVVYEIDTVYDAITGLLVSVTLLNKILTKTTGIIDGTSFGSGWYALQQM